jgi:hypothetical protein
MPKPNKSISKTTLKIKPNIDPFKKDKTKAFKLFLEGYSVRKIAEITGINRNTLWDWVTKNSWNELRALANERIIENLISDYTLSKFETLKQLSAMRLKAYERYMSAEPVELDAIQSGKLYLEILKILRDETDIDKFFNPETRDLPYPETRKQNEGLKHMQEDLMEIIRLQRERVEKES